MRLRLAAVMSGMRIRLISVLRASMSGGYLVTITRRCSGRGSHLIGVDILQVAFDISCVPGFKISGKFIGE